MILITGGTGFIGQYVVNDMLEKDYDTRLLVRDENKAKAFASKAEIFKGDATKLETLKRIEKDVDVLVHMVGAISLDQKENFLFNLKTTENILKVCKNVGKIIYTSSADVYGPVKGIADEDYECRPNNPYGASKLKAEKLIMDTGVPNLILRPTLVYGVNSPWWKYGMGLLKWGFIPETDNYTQLVHVKDVSRAIMIGVKKGRGIYNIADPEPIKITEMFAKVVELLGKKPRKVPMWFAKLGGVLMNKGEYFEVALTNRVFSNKNAGKKLGFYPKCDFNSEFKNMVDWYKNLNK
jgi:nucleoside-diphosphate-sugar epimerase